MKSKKHYSLTQRITASYKKLVYSLLMNIPVILINVDSNVI